MTDSFTNLEETQEWSLAELATAVVQLHEQHRDQAHGKTRQLAREFLNDWTAIWQVLAYPDLPITNNVAEQALRHWVIARKISHGTRTAEGSRASRVKPAKLRTVTARLIDILSS